MVEIFLSQDLRVRGQDLLHLVVRQGRQQGKTSGSDTQGVAVAGVKRMNTDWVWPFLAMDADGVDASRNRKEGRVASLLAQPHEGSERDRMDAETSACESAQNVDLRSDVVASCFRILVEKACPYQGEKHPPDGRLWKIALLDKLREAGTERPRPTNEEEQGGGTVDALSAAGSSGADRLHGLFG
jgi:hypothetical protein